MIVKPVNSRGFSFSSSPIQQPRNDNQSEDALDACLTIQSLHTNSSLHPPSGSGKNSNKGGSSGTKQRHVRPKKERSEHGTARVTIQHHPPIDEAPPKYSLKPPMPYMVNGNPPHYFPPSSFPVSSYFSPASPSVLHSPMMPSPEQQCSPLQISPNAHPLPQVGPQAYQVSPNMAQLSPISGAFPSIANQPSPNATSSMYNSNPASPMQVVYSPAQPLMRVTSTNSVYQQNGMGELLNSHIPSAYTDHPGVHMPPHSQQYIPSHPPPEYSEATGLSKAQLALTLPGMQPLAIGSEYPANHLPALPEHGPPSHYC